MSPLIGTGVEAVLLAISCPVEARAMQSPWLDLLDAGADPARISKGRGTIMREAANTRDRPRIRFLLRRGVGPDRRGKGYETRSMFALINAPWRALDLLKAGSPGEMRNAQRQSIQRYLFIADDKMLNGSARDDRRAVLDYLTGNDILIETWDQSTEVERQGFTTTASGRNMVDPYPAPVPMAPPSPVIVPPGHRLPSSYISSNVRSIICPNGAAAINLLESIVDRDPGVKEVKSQRCRWANMHIRITGLRQYKTVTPAGGRETWYLAFGGESWSPQNSLEETFGVINMTSSARVEYTQLEKWQHLSTPFDGRLRRGPDIVKDTTECPHPKTAIKLIQGRIAADQEPPDNREIRRLEKLLGSCRPASGRFQPMELLIRWERDGWVWTALKARNEQGRVVGLVHTAVYPQSDGLR